MKSNVKLKSNIFIRNGSDIRHDKQFQSQVRGRKAIERLLQIISSDTSEFTAARRLNFRQRLEYYLDLRCTQCGSIPEGPVRRNGSVSYEFRCPGRECRVNPITIKQVDLNREVVESCIKEFGPNLHTIIQRALDRPVPNSLIPLSEDSLIARSCAIKLTRYQGHIFRYHTLPELSEIINTALIYILQEKNDRSKP